MMIKYIDQNEIRNKRILVRVDFNVPLDKDGHVTNDERIVRVIPTLKHLLDRGNRLIIVSHLGRPKGHDPMFSINPTASRLADKLPRYEVHVIDNFTTEPKLTFESQTDKQILFLENIRYFKEEKTEDADFVKKLADLADVYVNDAFAVCHRSGASITGITKLLPSYGGLLLKREVEALDKAVHNPTKPMLAIIAGAKISTKISLIESLLRLADFLVIGGALSNPLLAACGYNIGKGFVEAGQDEEAKRIIKIAKSSACELILPVDRVGKLPDGTLQTVTVDRVTDELETFDIGPETNKKITEIIKKSKTIIWNGPVGMFEDPNFATGTENILKAIAQTQALSVVGGGDTIAAIADKPESDKITHISTGGGAMLEYIEKGTLPGIDALKQ